MTVISEVITPCKAGPLDNLMEADGETMGDLAFTWAPDALLWTLSADDLTFEIDLADLALIVDPVTLEWVDGDGVDPG